jgi:hypothetical protein
MRFSLLLGAVLLITACSTSAGHPTASATSPLSPAVLSKKRQTKKLPKKASLTQHDKDVKMYGAKQPVWCCQPNANACTKTVLQDCNGKWTPPTADGIGDESSCNALVCSPNRDTAPVWCCVTHGLDCTASTVSQCKGAFVVKGTDAEKDATLKKCSATCQVMKK